jgi:hypothetical protein
LSLSADMTSTTDLPTMGPVPFSCPNGLHCTIPSGTYQLFLFWSTPTGISPKATRASGVITSSTGGIRIPWNSLTSSPPPNATGWIVSGCEGVNSDCADIIQAIDGYNAACSTGMVTNPQLQPSGYVVGYGRGTACALGQDMYLFGLQENQPISPSQGASDNFAMIGNTGNQTQAGIPFLNGSTLSCYGCRIDNLTLELGPAHNIMEPYGVGVLDQLGQEGSGVGYDGGCVNIDDASLAGLYMYSYGAQNSGSNCIHYSGAIWDYTYGEILEDVVGPRSFSNFSAMGPLQGTQFLARAGIWINGTNGAAQPTITVSDIETEASECGVRIDNASAALTNIVGGGPTATAINSGRPTVNTVCLGPWSHDVTVSLVTPGGSVGTGTDSACPIWNESPSAAWNTLLNPSDQCDSTKKQNVAFYTMGSTSGNGGPTSPICSSDPFEGCYPIPTANACSVYSLSSSASCANARAGNFTVPGFTTTFTVYSTAVTANSTIIVQNIQDSSGIPTHPACGTTYNPAIQVSRTPGASFAITLLGSVSSTECYTFEIIN